jgi:hypothetical protein
MKRPQLYPYQEHFDFAAGTLPEALLFDFGDQLERAQAILRNRNKAQVGDALESLDWLLRTGDALLLKDALSSDKEQGTVISRVKALLHLIDHVDINELEDFPNPSWADYFATLVMAYVAEAVYAHDNPAPDLPPDLAAIEPQYAERQRRAQTEAALEAMDAIGHAERFQAVNDAQQAARKATVEHNTKAARIRVQPFNELRQRVIEIYHEHYTDRSNRDAAKRIWNENLTDTEKDVLTSDEPTKRLEIWIGQFKRKVSDAGSTLA